MSSKLNYTLRLGIGKPENPMHRYDYETFQIEVDVEPGKEAEAIKKLESIRTECYQSSQRALMKKREK